MASCAKCVCGKPSSGTENVVSFNTLAPEIQKLLTDAVDVRQRAYCPYSKFKVGAAVMCSDGKVFKGCNIENVAFTVGTCAERVAYGKAISEGHKIFKAVAVIAQQENSFCTPCGACRQFMSEFGDVAVYCGKPNLDQVLVGKLTDLLPYGFTSLT